MRKVRGRLSKNIYGYIVKMYTVQNTGDKRGQIILERTKSVDSPKLEGDASRPRRTHLMASSRVQRPLGFCVLSFLSCLKFLEGAKCGFKNRGGGGGGGWDIELRLREKKHGASVLRGNNQTEDFFWPSPKK